MVHFYTEDQTHTHTRAYIYIALGLPSIHLSSEKKMIYVWQQKKQTNVRRKVSKVLCWPVSGLAEVTLWRNSRKSDCITTTTTTTTTIISTTNHTTNCDVIILLAFSTL